MPFFQAALIGTNPVGDQFHAGFSVETSALGEQSAQALAEHIAEAWESTFNQNFSGQSLMGQYTTGTHFTKVVTYERPKDPAGKAIEVGEKGLVAQAGDDGGPNLPPETAVCISLLTGAPGRSRRGRMYMPAPSSVVLAPDGKLDAGFQTIFANWAGAFFGAVNNTLNGVKVVVWSRKNASTADVTQIAVGNQLDVQRRRQNNGPETYQIVDVSQV